MGRFMSRVKQGAELGTALKNYTDYLDNYDKRETPRTKGGAVTKTRASQQVAVIPFGTKDDTKVRVRTSKEGFGKLSSDVVSGRTFDDLKDSKDAPSGYRPAVVTVHGAKTGERSRVQSKMTKLFYIKYGGEVNRSAFGAKAKAEEFDEGKAAVITLGLKKIEVSDYKRVSVTDERFTKG